MPRRRLVLPLLALVALPLSQALSAQEAARVSGTVTSADDGRPLPGARVFVKGTSIGTLTGANGRYTLNARTPDDTLVVSLIGYRPFEVAIGGRTVVNVSMEAAAIMMQDVVVTGYGVQQRRDITGAVASIDSTDLPRLATSSAEQLLQGRIAGLQVTPRSGKPGDSSVVRIRGIGTLNNASPLYVVDGLLLDDIAFLSPSDIASVEVLKDASATAIYGARGANGVILITTKRGGLERNTRFALRASSGVQTVLDPIDLVNGTQYATLANELAANSPPLPPYFTNPNAVGAGTDWQEQIFEPAPMQNYEVSAAGGTQRTSYYFSASYLRQSGVVPKSDYNRLTVRLNNDYQLNDRLQIGHNLAFSHTTGLRAPNVLGALYRADPTLPPRNPDGTFSDLSVRATSGGNPAAAVFYTRNEDGGGRLAGNVFAELNLPGHFTFRSSFGLDYNRTQYRNFVPEYFVSPTQQNVESDFTVEDAATDTWLWENTATYDYVTDRHRLNVVAGITAQSFYRETLGCGRTNLVGESEAFWYCGAGDAAAQTNSNSAEDWRMLSYLFRANYALLDRYLLTASWRIDGSSRFGAANRYGHFPALALGWNLKQEAFLRDRPTISALKLRASWGRTGNDKIGPYPAVALVTTNLNTVLGPGETLVFGQSPISLANPEVRWEQTTQTDVGVDASLWEGRIEATVDYYHRYTDGILVQVPIPRYVGAWTEPFVNAAEVVNSGLEATVTWRDRRGTLEYELGLNGATINNRVEKLAEGREQILSGGLGNEITFSTRTVPGQPIGCYWGYKVLGVFQTPTEIASSPKRGPEQPGDLRYADLNSRDAQGRVVPIPDGVVNEDDKTFIGCPIPDMVYGFNGRVSWRGFDLSVNVTGQAGNEVFNGKKAVRFGVENFETSYLDRWTGPGTSNREPRVTNAGHNYQASDRFIEDGGFLKVQNVQLGVLLPASVARWLRVSQARIYVNGTNPLQVSNYSGYTPEVTAGSVIANGIDLGVFPPARTFTVGLDLAF